MVQPVAVEEPSGEHPWRKGTAVRQPYRRGSKRGLDDVANDAKVIKKLILAKFAAGSLSSMRSRVKWWAEICKPREWALVPITQKKLELAGALLREGGYRSACLYLAVMKRLHVQAGYQWTEQLALEMTDIKRAVRRGRGPDRQADPLSMEAIGELSDEVLEEARKDYWPAAGRDAAVICCAWLVREVEASTAFEGAVTLSPGADGECEWVTWDMPASKADWLALGKQRSLACACPSSLCPAAAMKRVLQVAKQENEGRSMDARGGPLLPKRGGAPMSKKEMTAFFCDLEALTQSTGKRITGHSARVTGAMRMAFAGHTLHKIKIFGRWGSDAVERYVREAILGKKGGNIAKVTEGLAKAKAKAKVKGDQETKKEKGRPSIPGRRLRAVLREE